jgi:hypothetical protein
MEGRTVKSLDELSSLSSSDITVTFALNSGYYFTNDVLVKIAQKIPSVQSLFLSQEYTEDKAHSVDFSLVSFPLLETLDMECVPLSTLIFTQDKYPVLKSLGIANTGPWDADEFTLRLPLLENLSLRFVHITDPSDFGESLSSSPLLEQLSCYKLWGLGRCSHVLNLGSMDDLDFYRSDDLGKLKIWAPRLSRLGLQVMQNLL